MFICFADDTLLVTSDDTYDDYISYTNRSLSLVSNWMSKANLSLNPNKTRASSTSISLHLFLGTYLATPLEHVG